MTNTKVLRKFFNYTQSQLAELLGVSRSTVAMWETTQQEPDYGTVNKMSMIFNVPSDFIMNSGIFKKWEQIKEYYEPIVLELRNTIPPTLEMPSFSTDHTLVAWLDTRLYFEPDELQLVRWFAFAVKDVHITPKEDTLDGEKDADIEITFTPEFKALIVAETNSRQLKAKKISTPVSGDGQSDAAQRFMPLVDKLTSDQQNLLFSQLQAWTEQNQRQAPAAPQSGGGKAP